MAWRLICVARIVEMMPVAVNPNPVDQSIQWSMSNVHSTIDKSLVGAYSKRNQPQLTLIAYSLTYAAHEMHLLAGSFLPSQADKTARTYWSVEEDVCISPMAT